MTRLSFTTIAYACTTCADTQPAQYIQSTTGNLSVFNYSGIINDGLCGGGSKQLTPSAWALVMRELLRELTPL